LATSVSAILSDCSEFFPRDLFQQPEFDARDNFSENLYSLSELVHAGITTNLIGISIAAAYY
jgi:hypothetical protein